MPLDWKLTASRNDLLRELEKVQAKLARQATQLQDVTNKSKAANREATRGARAQNKYIGDQITALKGLAGGALSVLGIQRQVTAELQRQKSINDTIAERRKSLVAREDDVKTNLGKVNAQTAQSFLTDLQRIAKDSNADLGAVYSAGSNLLSASMGNQVLTRNILSQTSPLFRNRPETLVEFSGGIGDLAGMAGMKSPTEGNIRDLIGLALSTQQQGRITNVADLNKYLQSVAAGTNVDTSQDRIGAMRTSLALNAAVGAMIVDPDGSLTKTGVAEFETALAELLPEKDIRRADGSIKRRGTGLQTTMERFERLLSSEQLQRELISGSPTMEKLSASGPILPVLQALARGGDAEVYKRFQSAYGEISPDGEFASKLQTNLDTVGLGATALMANRQRSAEESAIVARPFDDLESTADRAFAAGMGEGGYDPGFVGRWWMSASAFMGHRVYGMNRADAQAYALENNPFTPIRLGGEQDRLLGSQTIAQLEARDEEVQVLREISQKLNNLNKLDNANAGAAAQVNAQREGK